jgi:hypothetical protein
VPEVRPNLPRLSRPAAEPAVERAVGRTWTEKDGRSRISFTKENRMEVRQRHQTRQDIQ